MQIEDYIESLGFQKLKWNVYGNERYEIHLENGVKVINTERSKIHGEPYVELLLKSTPTNELLLHLLKISNIL
jgi:hypothetical protein